MVAMEQLNVNLFYKTPSKAFDQVGGREHQTISLKKTKKKSESFLGEEKHLAGKDTIIVFIHTNAEHR